MILSPFLKRRLAFVIDAAKNEEKKDQTVTFAMRVLSNFATIGKDAQSSTIKGLNKNISTKAKNILYSDNMNLKKFCELTINEHPKPLKEIWNMTKENSHKISIERLWLEFIDNKMITITKDEDSYLRKAGFGSSGSVKDRYLNIKTETLDETPIDYFKKKNQKK